MRKVNTLGARIDHEALYIRMWEDGNHFGFFRISDAAKFIGCSRPTVEKLIRKGTVREVRLFPDLNDPARFVSISDLFRLPSMPLRLDTDGEVRKRITRPWEE